jgi:hypothetical protein
MPERFSLDDIGCPKCAGRVTLRVEDWTPGGPDQRTAWTCPWCRHESETMMPGRIVGVSPSKRTPPRWVH